MLTGDKIETATCIAISTGLKGKNQKIFEMKELNNWGIIERELKVLSDSDDTILVIDGNTLKHVIEDENEKYFFEIASKVSPKLFLI
jgi:phospholipid-translocating ATPase